MCVEGHGEQAWGGGEAGRTGLSEQQPMTYLCLSQVHWLTGVPTSGMPGRLLTTAPQWSVMIQGWEHSSPATSRADNFAEQFML